MRASTIRISTPRAAARSKFAVLDHLAKRHCADLQRIIERSACAVIMVKLSVLVSAGLSLALPTTLQAQISFDTVLRNCEKKTQVWGRDEKGKAVKVGERIDGYCQGVLEGVFAILARTGTICVKNKSTSPDFCSPPFSRIRLRQNPRTMTPQLFLRRRSNVRLVVGANGPEGASFQLRQQALRRGPK